jgi:hypothetical protein
VGVTFEFDMFDVTLDFDEAVATVADALGDKQSETAPLDDFLPRAASFGDRPVRRRRAHGNEAAAAPLHRRPRRNVRPASDETAP